jgi:predicted component of type VI protein secretion system
MFVDASQMPAFQQAAAAAAMATAPTVFRARLVLLREDGSEGGSLHIESSQREVIGRAFGPPFDQDAYLEPHHVELEARPDGIAFHDRSAGGNGVFLRLIGRTELRHGDMFRVGQELLAFEELPEPEPAADGSERMGSPNPGYWGRVSLLVEPGWASAAYPIAEAGLGIGREHGDVTFPNDGYVSGRHCRIAADDSGIWLEDLGSSNGTYVRVRDGQVLAPGTHVQIGMQLFRVDGV